MSAKTESHGPYLSPGATIDVEISGTPGSTVYLSAVDEGVLLLGDKRLTAVEVLDFI